MSHHSFLKAKTCEARSKTPSTLRGSHLKRSHSYASLSYVNIDTIEKRSFSKPVVGEQGESCIIIKTKQSKQKLSLGNFFEDSQKFSR